MTLQVMSNVFDENFWSNIVLGGQVHGHGVHPPAGSAAVVDGWDICSLGSQGRHHQGVCQHVEEQGGQGYGVDIVGHVRVVVTSSSSIFVRSYNEKHTHAVFLKL